MSFGAFGASVPTRLPPPSTRARHASLLRLRTYQACSCVRRARVAGPSACVLADRASKAPSQHNSVCAHSPRSHGNRYHHLLN